MKTLLLLGVLLLVASASVGAQQIMDGPNPNNLVNEQDLLNNAIMDGRAVPPEQAVASVRDSCGNPNLEVVIHSFVDTPTSLFQERTYYSLRVDDGADAGMYQIRGDGAVYTALRDSDAADEQPPLITLEGARALAEQFARAYYPNFDQRQWVVPRGWPMTVDYQYHFSWREVLNTHGALARWPLTIHVDGVTGKIVTYFRPTDRVAGPTVPQVTRVQAEQIAAAMAPDDPALVPFSEVLLEVVEDQFGTQGLDWVLYQPEPDTEGLRYEILVDAITGDATAARGPLGTVPPRHPRSTSRTKKPVIPRVPPIRLTTASGAVIR